MKLRRRRKEEGLALRVLLSPSQAVTRAYAPALLPSSFHSLSLHPAPPARSSATCREGNALQLSLPSCFASPFLLHKITEATERGEKDRGGAPTLPTQLSCLTITGRAPSSPATLAPSSNRVAAASLRFQWRSLCDGWSHRKTKYENELSCFITFIDE